MCGITLPLERFYAVTADFRHVVFLCAYLWWTLRKSVNKRFLPVGVQGSHRGQRERERGCCSVMRTIVLHQHVLIVVL